MYNISDTEQKNILIQLKNLFELRGFREIKINKFEEYSLYLENRNLFNSQNIVTFTGSDGKLMALKPDITLSIINSIPKKMINPINKFYYIDEVCRLSKDVNEYKVTDQIGVEIIGKEDAFVNLEILDLAIESLKKIEEQFILDISHLGFISGLFATMKLPQKAEDDVMRAIHSKSRHGLEHVLTDVGVSSEKREIILTLTTLSGNLQEILPQISDMVLSDQMQDAYNELCLIKTVLEATNSIEFVNLDFSVINDLNYYNGLIFKGYVKDISEAVLTGGRYDNLVRKMGKNSCAIGFALSLTEICKHLNKGRENRYDVLLTYDEDCKYQDLLCKMKSLVNEGKRVKLEPYSGQKQTDLEYYHFTKCGLERG